MRLQKLTGWKEKLKEEYDELIAEIKRLEKNSW